MTQTAGRSTSTTVASVLPAASSSSQLACAGTATVKDTGAVLAASGGLVDAH